MSKPALAMLTLAAGLWISAAAFGVMSDSWSAGGQGGHPNSISIEEGEGGQVLTVSLKPYDDKAKVLRARLYASRGRLREANDTLADIEICTGGTSAGKPLALVAPEFNCFDVTEPVRAALAGGGPLKLFVKAFPGWEQEKTRLEVVMEGRAAHAPAAVKGLKVFHRAGQTFVTWNEVEPLISAQKAAWGEIRKKLADAPDACAYRVYAHTKPIDAATIAEAEFVGEAGPLSEYNANGRNMEYLIGQAMIQPDEVGELARDYNGYMYSWGPDSPRMDRYPVDRFVIDEKAGALPPGTGLYVHQPAAAGKRYYAVVACKQGVENLGDFSTANSLDKPVDEVVGPGEPVLQGDGLRGPFFDYPGRRKVYVQWTAPPLSPRPNMYFNWSVLVPPEATKAAPVELYFHAGNYSYARPNAKYLADSIQIAPHDSPFSGWYGFNDAYGTLKSCRAGAVSNHTQKRIMVFLDWAKGRFPIDPDRILLLGGDGAAMLALTYPDQFAYVVVTGFEAGVLNPKSAARYLACWGPKSPQVKDDKGRGEWEWAMLDKVVAGLAGENLPLFHCKGASWGVVKGYGAGRGLFYSAMQQARQPLYAHWAWGGTLYPPDRYTGLWRGMDIRRTTPIPAINNSSADAEGEGSGQANMVYAWKDVKDEPGSFQITITGGDSTFDLTPRRLRQFNIQAGEKVQWSAACAPPKTSSAPALQEGQTSAGANGQVTLTALRMSGGFMAIKITRVK